ncbi:MAG: hypothetical protein RLZZ401_352 [Pseudomonadota bacterium]
MRLQVQTLQARELLLQQSEERYRALVEHIGEGMSVLQDGRVVFANIRAIEIMKLAPDSVLGASFVQWLHPDDRALAAGRQALLQQGAAALDHNELRVVDADGSLRWMDVRATPIPWQGNAATMCLFSDITDRKTVLDALHRSEERYRQVVENLGEGMVVMQNEHCVFVNERATELTRLPRAELLAQGFYRHVHPDDRRLAQERHRRASTGASAAERHELRLLHRDGNITWLEVGITPVPWSGKTSTLTFFTDVSHRKHLEDRLRTTLEERETILQHSMMGIAFLTPNGRFRWANQSMRGIFRAGDANLDSMEPLYRSRAHYVQVGQNINDCIAVGRDYQSEQQMRRLDGTLFWALLSGKAVNPQNASQGTVWVVMDISERKALESALARTSVEREAILNSTLVGISYNMNRHIGWVNDKYIEMTGFTRDELVGRSSRMFYDSDEAYERDGAEFRAVLQSGKPYISERQIKRRNGESFWVMLAGRCVMENNPEGGVIWTMLDVTERRQAEEDIRAALQRQTELNALRSRFVAMTSHEFRTPLATILSSAELLRYYSDRMAVPERMETLENIEGAVHRMTRMLERVLLIGKSDADMLEFSPSAVDLDALCRTLLGEVTSQQPGAVQRAHYRFEVREPVGLYDENLLRHIFSNLLSNAFKYSPQGQKVLFHVREEGGGVVFDVIDQGIGIPASEIAHLFESFHRASNVGNIPGTGLGLSIVKKSVELHGGTIEVTSQAGDAPDHGTHFVVRL